MAIVYKCSSRKVLGYIDTEGAGSTEPGDPYLSHFPDIYSNVSVRPVVIPPSQTFVNFSNVAKQKPLWLVFTNPQY